MGNPFDPLPSVVWVGGPGADDANPGTQTQPLATLARAVQIFNHKRLPRYPTIQLQADVEETVDFVLDGSVFAGLALQGQRRLLGSGQIDALQSFDQAAKHDQRLTCNGIPSWSGAGFVGALIVLTSGPNTDAWAFIKAELGGDVALVGPFWDPALFAYVDPGVGQTFNVYALTRITGSVTSTVSGGGTLYCQDIVFDNGGGGQAYNDPLTVCLGYVELVGCMVQGNDPYPAPGFGAHLFVDGAVLLAEGCWFEAHIRAVRGGGAYFAGCLFSRWGTAPTADGAGSIIEYDDFCVGYGDESAAQTRNGGCINVLAPVAFFDQSIACVTAGPRGVLVLAAVIWGARCTGLGIGIGSGGRALILAGCVPDIVDDPVAQTYPTRQVNLAGVVHTFVELASTIGAGNALANAPYDAAALPFHTGG